MKKMALFLALLFLAPLGIPSLAPAQYPPYPMIEQSPLTIAANNLKIHALADAKQMENAEAILLADNFALRGPSLVTEAHAVPVVPVKEIEQPPPRAVGAWFIGFGLLAFVISRKRFKK